MTTLIKNALVYDGVSREPRRADIFFDTKKIRAVRPRIRARADRIFDARGEAVFPGLLDTNPSLGRREDFLTDEAQKEFLRRGITTLIAPYPLSLLSTARLRLHAGSLFDYRSVFSPFLSSAKMLGLVERGLEDGALGIFFDWGDPVSYPFSLRSLTDVGSALSSAKKVCVFHLDPSRSSSGLLHMFSRIFSGLRAKLHFSRFRPQETLFHEWVSGRSLNQYADISFASDVPYPIFGLLPPSFHRLEFEEMARRIRDREYEKEILSHLEQIPLSDIRLGRVPPHVQHFSGKRFRDLVFRFQLPLARAALHFMRISDLEATVLLRNAAERHAFSFLRHPSSTLSSGGTIPFATQLSGARVFHVSDFPRLAESSGLFLGEVLAKMTSVPARLYGIPRRGRVEEGSLPDLVIARDWVPAKVFVGGELAFHNGVFSDSYSGKIIKV